MLKKGDPDHRRDLVVEFEVVATAAQQNRVTVIRRVYREGSATVRDGWLLVSDEWGEVAGFANRCVRHWWYDWIPRS